MKLANNIQGEQYLMSTPVKIAALALGLATAGSSKIAAQQPVMAVDVAVTCNEDPSNLRVHISNGVLPQKPHGNTSNEDEKLIVRYVVAARAIEDVARGAAMIGCLGQEPGTLLDYSNHPAVKAIREELKADLPSAIEREFDLKRPSKQQVRPNP